MDTIQQSDTIFSPNELDIVSDDKLEQMIFEDNLDNLPPLGDTILGNKNSDYAVLMIHGFTGTNLELLYMANKIALNGFRVAIPLLQGHGKTSTELKDYSYEDWRYKVKIALEYLKNEKTNRKIIVLGHSMGGALAIDQTADNDNVIGLILLGTPIRYNMFLRLFVNVSYVLGVKVPFDDVHFSDERLYDHPLIKENLDNYSKISMKSIKDVFDLLRLAYNKLPKINQPTLMIYAEDDFQVSEDHATIIRENIGSDDIQIHWMKHSNHILPIDIEKEKVTTKVSRFLNRLIE